jgi:hypothetical protein
VVVDKVNVAGIAIFEPEYHSPIAVYDHGPKSLAIAGHRMQAKPRRIHVQRLGGGVETRQHTLDLTHEVGAYLASVAALKKPLKPAMAKIPDHPSVPM